MVLNGHCLQEKAGCEIDILFCYRKNYFAIKNQVARFQLIFAIEEAKLFENCDLIFLYIFFIFDFFILLLF